MDNIIDTDKLLKFAVIIIIILIAANIINILIGEPSLQITRLIDLNSESNIPTWFSSILLFVAAFFAYRCSLLAKTKQNGKLVWQVFSLGLLVMSCDEVATIHERTGYAINKYLFKFARPEDHTWLLTIGPLAIITIFVFCVKIRKYLKGSAKASRLLTIGLIVYFFGSIVFESTLEFIYNAHIDILHQVEIMLEESFEMIGVIIVIGGLVEHNKFLENIYGVN